MDVWMNANSLSIDSSMTSPAWCALTGPPPVASSRTLVGMEKVIPPDRPSLRRSPDFLATNVDQHLSQPSQSSPRSSSDYSVDSDYGQIIELYTGWKTDKEPAAPIAVQARGYRDRSTVLPPCRLLESSSCFSALTTARFPKAAVSIPSLQLPSEDWTATSASDIKATPSFIEFSKNLQAKRADLVPSFSTFVSPNYAASSDDTIWQPALRYPPVFGWVPVDDERRGYLSRVSPRSTDIVKSDLLPPPLDLAKLRSSSNQDTLSIPHADCGSEMAPSDQSSSSKYSTMSASDSSSVMYKGSCESTPTIFGSKTDKNKESVQKRKENARSVASTADQVLDCDSARQTERKVSWVSSRKSSLQGGITDRLPSLSLTKSPSGNSQTPSSARVGQEQPVLPPSLCQKHGTAICHTANGENGCCAITALEAPNNATSAGATARLPTKNRCRNPRDLSLGVLRAFHSGRNQILDALGETKQEIVRTNTGGGMGAQKSSIAMQGPGDDSEVRQRLFRSRSQRRREKLKKSIALVGPIDPYSLEPTTRMDSDEPRNVLKNSIKHVGLLEGQSTRQVEHWL